MNRKPNLRAAFVVGGPLFNAGLIAILMAISFLAVALPDRSDEVSVGGDAPAAIAFTEERASRSTTPTTATTIAPSTSTSTAAPTPSTVVRLDPEQMTAIRRLFESVAGGGVSSGPTSTTVPPPAPEPEEVVRVVYRTEPAPEVPARPECTDYETRREAQQAFAAAQVRLAHFDGDGDGIACEHIPDPDQQSIATCSDFAKQPAAQAVFDSDRKKFSHFDGDGDGRACEQLPGAPPEPIEIAPPPAVPSIAEVRNQTSVFGLHTREAPWWMGEVDHVSRLVGKAPNTLLFFSNWSTPFPAEEVATAWSRGMTPHIAWEPVIPGSGSHPKLAEIAAGDWDPYIDAWAEAAVAHGQPIVLRFAAEMNGNWYPWSENGFGNSPGEFAPAWRHVHDRFRLAGADNVVWLWSVNRVDNLSTDMSGYWPGGDYVDWVGISGYWRGYQAAPEASYQAVFGRTIGELRQLTEKPILLAEMGAGTEVDADRVDFLESVFAGLATDTDIIGFVYFNDRKAGGDWRVQYSQRLVDAFAAGVGNERWPSGVLPPGMELGERVSIPAYGDPEVDLGNPDG